MNTSLQGLLEIPTSRLEDINRVLLDPQMEVIQEFLGVVAKYGTPAEINAKAEAASRPEEDPAATAQISRGSRLADRET